MIRYAQRKVMRSLYRLTLLPNKGKYNYNRKLIAWRIAVLNGLSTNKNETKISEKNCDENVEKA